MNFALYVKDMEKSLAFYHDLLDLPVLRKQPIGEGKELVFLGTTEGGILELVPTDTDTAYAGFVIGFEVEDLPAVKARLEDGGYPIKQELNPNSSTTLCFFAGPNGEEVELIKYK